MSIQTMKKKSVIQYGSKRSGKSPGGIWLPQGPFGHATQTLRLAAETYGPVGFSINGGHRNIGRVGQDMKMSKSGTPFRGLHPIGFGGTHGQYPSATLVGSVADGVQSTGCIPNHGSRAPAVDPVLNSRVVDTLGTQSVYIKPSTLSTRGMLRQRYRWAYTGQYPNFWVQPVYTGNQVDTASQQLYIQNKAAANVCALKVNDTALYADNYRRCGPTLCRPGTSTAKFKYNDMARNGPYTKILGQPVSYDTYQLHLTRKCNDPQGPQKPFPFAVQTGTGHSAAGTRISRFGSSCGTQNVYVAPPEWYIGTPSSE